MEHLQKLTKYHYEENPKKLPKAATFSSPVQQNWRLIKKKWLSKLGFLKRAILLNILAQKGNKNCKYRLFIP